jgi:hypothetical protein
MNYSFRESKSNETAMNDFFLYSRCHKKNTKLTRISFDLSKAHDILNHNILLSKLEACGIRHIAYLPFK